MTLLVRKGGQKMKDELMKSNKGNEKIRGVSSDILEYYLTLEKRGCEDEN